MRISSATITSVCVTMSECVDGLLDDCVRAFHCGGGGPSNARIDVNLVQIDDQAQREQKKKHMLVGELIGRFQN